MLPARNPEFAEIETTIKPSKTYRVDVLSKRIVGMVDGTDSLVQAIDKLIKTEAFSYEIYFDYGVRLEELTGQDADFVKSVIESRIQEALLMDGRVQSIANFQHNHIGDKLDISFGVMSYEGFFPIRWEVLL